MPDGPLQNPGGAEPLPVTEGSAPSKKPKTVVGVALALAVVVGLYAINRYWIAPATSRHSQGSQDHPMAPDFTLVDLSGRKLTLSDYRGKVVLLDFWATWCGPCRIEIPGFVELQNRYREQGLVVIGLSKDESVDPVGEFYREYKMNYPVAMVDEKVDELFGGILGLPTTFLIGRDGRVYAKHIGATSISVFEEQIKKLLAASGPEEVADFTQAGRMGQVETIELGDPAEINSEVPGVNLSKLTAAQKEQFKNRLAHEPCDCGCKMSLLDCRLKDRSCGVSRKLAREQLEKFLKAPA